MLTMTIKRARVWSLIIGLGVVIFNSGHAMADEIYTGYFSDEAVSGYDTVSFFTEIKSIKGKKEFKVEYLGTEWFFSSAANKALFLADPEKYRPQYGGYCAWAAAVNNAKAPGSVDYWKIVDGKLYLNYSRSVQEKWLKNIEGFIVDADKNWSTLKDQ
ncbi:MAG: YHS domain-containing protein [Lentisphaeria bacterium]|jgi:YHS domain-containing protein